MPQSLTPTTIVWFRQDLRLADNPALAAAAQRGKILPVYIQQPHTRDYATMGSASHWWLHHTLQALQKSLGYLHLASGNPAEILENLIEQTGADAVYWNRCYEPHAITRDSEVKARLRQNGIAVESFNAALLHEPWEIKTGTGGPYKVFTPFWRTVQGLAKSPPALKPDTICIHTTQTGETLDDWHLLPAKPDWAANWRDHWTPGEQGAHDRLEDFIKTRLQHYSTKRDLPAQEATSRLSPHLHFGEISPRQIWHRIKFAIAENPTLDAPAQKFLSELAWREFSYHLLYHFPHLPEENWKPQFNTFQWRNTPDDLSAWQCGQTGYPMVDAGMRELWATGTMHNRVRMITASFLIKHLRIDWREGEKWFWDTLVDADLASNAASWQWVAGSGADASPYFRIFNPITQGQKFDPEGAYIRRWCPELKKLDTSFIHAPWEAPKEALQSAGIKLGTTYPRPIVDHKQARAAALAAFADIKDA